MRKGRVYCTQITIERTGAPIDVIKSNHWPQLLGWNERGIMKGERANCMFVVAQSECWL